MNITLYRMPQGKDWRVFGIRPWLCAILLYVSFCLAGAFGFRSSLIMLARTGVIDTQMHWIAFVICGIPAMLWMEILLFFYTNYVRVRYPHFDPSNFKHVFRCIYIVRNLVMTAVNTAMYLAPLSIAFVSQPVDFVVTSAFLLCFFFYYTGRNLPAFLQGQALSVFAKPYIAYSVISAILLVVAGVYV